MQYIYASKVFLFSSLCVHTDYASQKNEEVLPPRMYVSTKLYKDPATKYPVRIMPNADMKCREAFPTQCFNCSFPILYSFRP